MVKLTYLLSALTFTSLVSVGLSKSRIIDGSTHPILLTAPGTMSPNSQETVTLTVNQAPLTATTIALSSSDSSQLTVPSSVTVPAGQTSAQFTATATASASTNATVTASANGYQTTSSVIDF